MTPSCRAFAFARIFLSNYPHPPATPTVTNGQIPTELPEALKPHTLSPMSNPPLIALRGRSLTVTELLNCLSGGQIPCVVELVACEGPKP